MQAKLIKRKKKFLWARQSRGDPEQQQEGSMCAGMGLVDELTAIGW